MPSAEHRARIERVNSLVRKAGLTVFLVTSKDSVYYLTGFKYEPFERPFFLIFRGNGDPEVIVPRIEAENMSQVPHLGKQYEYIDFPAMPGHGWLETLGQYISRGEVIGVEPSLPSELFVRLKDYAPRVEPIIERARLVKSKEEIERIELTSRFSDLGMKMLFEASHPGAKIEAGYRRIEDLKKAVIQQVGHLDQYVSSMWMGVWAAPFSAQPHRFPQPEDTLGDGPNVALVFIRVNGYSAETERTYFVTEPTAEERNVFKTLTQARQIGFEMLRPGVRAHDVDHKVMSFLRAEGLADNLLHRTGHGIGMGGHEGPWVAEGGDDVLEEGMVVSVEPGIYWRGKGGYRHSDTVLITANGYRSLTKFPTAIEDMVLAS